MAGARDRLEGARRAARRPAVRTSDRSSGRSASPTTSSVGTSSSARRVSADGSGQTVRTSSSKGSCCSYERTVIAAVSVAHVGGRVRGEPHPRLLLGRAGEIAALDQRLLLGEARLRLLRPLRRSEARSDEDELRRRAPASRRRARAPRGRRTSSRRRPQARRAAPPRTRRSRRSAARARRRRNRAGRVRRRGGRPPRAQSTCAAHIRRSAMPACRSRTFIRRRRAVAVARRTPPGRSSRRPPA